ncbi:MAG: hypothetical protein RLZZ237_3794 [Pseudomonadota bacterium]
MAVGLQQFARQQPEQGQRGADQHGQGQVAQGAQRRQAQEQGAQEQGDGQRHRRDPAAREGQSAQCQAQQGGIAQRCQFHIAYGAVQQVGQQRHIQRFGRDVMAVGQQAQATEVDQDGGVGQGTAEVVRFGLAAKGQAQRLGVATAAQVESRVPDGQGADGEDTNGGRACAEHLAIDPAEQFDEDGAQPEGQRAFLGHGHAGDIRP